MDCGRWGHDDAGIPPLGPAHKCRPGSLSSLGLCQAQLDSSVGSRSLLKPCRLSVLHVTDAKRGTRSVIKSSDPSFKAELSRNVSFPSCAYLSCLISRHGIEMHSISISEGDGLIMVLASRNL